MKKILQRIFLSLLAVIVIVVGVGIYWFTHDPDKPGDNLDGYVTDAQGMTYTLVANPQGETYVVITDKDNNRYAAEYDGTTVGSTVGQINDEISIEDVPTNYTGTHVDVTNDISKFQGEVSTTKPTTTKNSQGKEDNTTTTSSKKPDKEDPTKPSEQEDKLRPYRIEKYQDVFTGGTYLMKITTNDETMGDEPVTMAIKNGNMYVEMAMEIDETTSMNCSMLYLNSKDTIYLIFDDFKKYCKMPEDTLGEDMDMGQMMEEMSDSGIGEISVSEVEINGEKLILESYVSTIDGTTVNYYFDNNDVLVRRDNIYTNGTVDSTYFAKITTDVPDSYFEIPSGYGYINLDWLELFN